jgi:hypothetical protein
MNMKIIKLTSEHKNLVKPLFENKKWMGVDSDQDFIDPELNFNEVHYDLFCDGYLSDLKQYHAYGSFDDNMEVKSIISFYESNDNPEWYWTHIRSCGNRKFVLPLLDKVIEHNENNGRFKFYSMWNIRYQNIYRKFAFSKYNAERYDYFEEFVVPAKTKCVWNMPWMILYGRTLVPLDTVVRCTFLKQQYREKLDIAGNI